MVTVYSFFNEDLKQEFEFTFIVRKKCLQDYVILQHIKEEIYSTSWNKEHFIVGEPLDPSFPIIEIANGSIVLIERVQDGYNLNALSLKLDSMEI